MSLALDALYLRICEQYPVDRNRVYATGMSMGGYFSNFVAAHCGDKLAVIASHSGDLGGVGFRGTGADTDGEGHKVAVLVIHGDADTVVPVSEGSKSQEYYEKAGHSIVYQEIEGLFHRWATGQKINDPMWKFFVEHPRGQEPPEDAKTRGRRARGRRNRGRASGRHLCRPSADSFRGNSSLDPRRGDRDLELRTSAKGRTAIALCTHALRGRCSPSPSRLVLARIRGSAAMVT